MKRTHPAMWGAGWAGLASGAIVTLVGSLAADEVGQLAAGYGAMLMASAAYLLVGLGLRLLLLCRSTGEPGSPPNLRRATPSGQRS